MDTVGFIGLGNMGSGMAGNIQKAGYPRWCISRPRPCGRSWNEKHGRPGRPLR